MDKESIRLLSSNILANSKIISLMDKDNAFGKTVVHIKVNMFTECVKARGYIQARMEQPWVGTGKRTNCLILDLPSNDKGSCHGQKVQNSNWYEWDWQISLTFDHMKKLAKTFLNFLDFDWIVVTTSLQFLKSHFVFPILFLDDTDWFNCR